jgi:hypothetical protein
MRSDHGLHRDRGRRCRWSDRNLGTGPSDQTGPVDAREEVPRIAGYSVAAVDQISAGLLVDASGDAVSVTRYGLRYGDERNRQPDECDGDDLTGANVTCAGRWHQGDMRS